MITPVWTEFGFSWLAMPVWTSVAIEDPPASPDEATALRDATSSAETPVKSAAMTEETADSNPRPAGADCPRKPEAIKFRLMFQGYAWHPQAQWSPFANPSWDRFVEDPAETRSLQLQHEREHEQRRPQAAQRRTDKPRSDPGSV